MPLLLPADFPSDGGMYIESATGKAWTVTFAGRDIRLVGADTRWARGTLMYTMDDGWQAFCEFSSGEPVLVTVGTDIQMSNGITLVKNGESLASSPCRGG